MKNGINQIFIILAGLTITFSAGTVAAAGDKKLEMLPPDKQSTAAFFVDTVHNV